MISGFPSAVFWGLSGLNAEGFIYIRQFGSVDERQFGNMYMRQFG